ncbi:MAG: tRNA (N6-threonylcarbamoyladenosine(37)-N6)-methyltransferase TrmO [Pirellulales bacterium]|nr:tRNA (N6-threonylcarbamoyladenosine(37)-N6)-methyltransferase TrmO [Pirellulales bacterium]
MKCLALVLLTIFVLGFFSARADSGGPPARQFTVSPIGHIKIEKGKTRIVLDKQYQPGLLGLDGFSHIHVYWWFDRNDTPKKRAVLQVHPRGDEANPLTGVFATRSPRRPNLIATTLCKIVSVKDNVIEIERIDAFAGTPVLDIKPYIPRSDTAAGATIPEWLKANPKKKSSTADK